MSDRVRQGSSVSDIVREALDAYLGMRQTERQTARPTQGASASASAAATSDTLSAMMSDTSDIRERLAHLEQQVEALSACVRQCRMLSDTGGDTSTPAQPSPQLLGTYDPQAAAARIQELRRQGFSLTRIAAQLDAEGIPTRYGLPWQHSSIRYLLKTYG